MWYARRANPVALLKERAPLHWPPLQTAIADLFKIGEADHFLKHPPGLMPNLWETQITKGLQALLLNSSLRTLERCQALFDVLAGPEQPRLSSVHAIEADDPQRRIDLAIHAQDIGGRKRCLVIEAKLEAKLEPHQLKTYFNLIKAEYRDASSRHLWIVGSYRSPSITESLSQHVNREWRFMTWRRLLLEWQRRLPDQPGADVLNIFSEIWNRVGGR